MNHGFILGSTQYSYVNILLHATWADTEMQRERERENAEEREKYREIEKCKKRQRQMFGSFLMYKISAVVCRTGQSRKQPKLAEPELFVVSNQTICEVTMTFA